MESTSPGRRSRGPPTPAASCSRALMPSRWQVGSGRSPRHGLGLRRMRLSGGRNEEHKIDYPSGYRDDPTRPRRSSTLLDNGQTIRLQVDAHPTGRDCGY